MHCNAILDWLGDLNAGLSLVNPVQKDYGGPLVCQEQERKVIVGVSIHGRGCALARRPAVFVNVAFYSEWIRKVYRTEPKPSGGTVASGQR